MAIFLVVAAGFAAWGWLRPYEWNPDPKAGAEVLGVELERDHSYYWMTVHVRAKGGGALDLSRPARLVVRSGRGLQPADTRLEGSLASGFREAWFRFWLESDDVSGPLRLDLQDGGLSVKSGGGVPDLAHGSTRHFTTHRW